MDSPGAIGYTTFPSVYKTEKKGFIPIRSIAYKKTLADPKDVEYRKDMLSTMTKFGAASPLVSAYTASPTRASTTYGNKPETPNYKPHMNYSFHKLSLGVSSTKNSHVNQKKGSHLLPNVRSPMKTMPPTSSALYSNRHFTPQLERMATKTANISPQEDYFKLLFDENRKVFKVEDCEGVDEYYTNEMIMTRIHNQGFRDAEYYGTRIQHVDMEVMDEKTIRDDYRFKIQPMVSTMENENTLAAHVLGGTWNNIKYVESFCDTQRNEIKLIKQEKKLLEKQIEDIKKKFDDEVKNINNDFSKKFERLVSVIKEDFVANQNENFKLQKEITLLQRDKLNLEREIENCLPILHQVEDIMYGRAIFNLEANDEALEGIPHMNLRPEYTMSMKNGHIIH